MISNLNLSKNEFFSRRILHTRPANKMANRILISTFLRREAILLKLLTGDLLSAQAKQMLF